MTIYVDENVPQKITIRLRAEGYAVEYVTRRVEDRVMLSSKVNRLITPQGGNGLGQAVFHL